VWVCKCVHMCASVCGFAWVYIDVPKCERMCVCRHGYAICVGVYGHVWVCVDMRGCVGVCTGVWVCVELIFRIPSGD
jgi:hypothetical protein